MKLKRFYASDTGKAMRLIREAFGPDAVILSNQRVDGGVEVVAAIDYDETVLSDPTVITETPKVSNTRGVEWIQEPAIAQMREELQMLRELMQNQLAGLAWNARAQQSPMKVKLLGECVNYSIPHEFADKLLDRIQDNTSYAQAWKALCFEFSVSIPVADDNILNTSGIHVFLGPTGVGKTTTIAKIAARYVLRNGPSQIGLITTDSYRIAAHEQLIAYGKILGIEVRLADSEEELANVLTRFRGKKLILIDTAGTSQRDQRIEQQLALFKSIPEKAYSHLVLSTTSHQRSIEETINRYKPFHLSSCLLTKLDEATTLAPVLVAISEQQIPISYLTDGQRVPEDLRRPNAKQLVEEAISLGNRYSNPLRKEMMTEAMSGSFAHA